MKSEAGKRKSLRAGRIDKVEIRTMSGVVRILGIDCSGVEVQVIPNVILKAPTFPAPYSQVCFGIPFLLGSMVHPPGIHVHHRIWLLGK